jgi:hypothetical protein
MERGCGSEMQGWPEGARLPLRRPAGSGVDERIPRRVLAEFGLPIDGNPAEYAPAYSLFLPQAADSGIRPRLRDARRLATGRIDPGNPEDLIEWLAAELCVPAPDGRNARWQRTWQRALERRRLERGPAELSESARRILVRRLASEPSYPSLFVDALAEAIAHDIG